MSRAAGSRGLPVDGLLNIRDLGGLPTADGGRIAPGRLIRSDNPRGLTEAGRRQFVDRVAPRLLIDLRTTLEVEREGYEAPSADTTVVNLPMMPLAGVNQEQIDAGAFDNLVDDYLGQIEVNGDSVAEAVRYIAEGDHAPVVVHCTAGKDRTGIVVAMVLDLVGVPHREIVADYHITAANMAPIVDRIRAARVFQANGLAAAPDWIFAADAATMQGFLAGVADRYGGAAGWARERGLGAADIAALRSHLVTRDG